MPDASTDYLDALLRNFGESASFNEIVVSCRGADPMVVLARLGALGRKVNVSPPADVKSERSEPLSYSTSCLPIPHPLDFEWRFTSACSDDLVKRALADRSEGEEIALLATPSVAERLASADHPEAERFTLFEMQRGACEALVPFANVTIEQCDVGQLTARGDLAGRYAVALADPPWYLPSLQSFVRSAAHLLRPGGVLRLCVPGLATRPGIDREREQIVAEARRVGLATESIEPEALRYESPPFELAAFLAAGLPLLSRRWRSGDLITFRKLANHLTQSTPTLHMYYVGAEWTEVVIGRSRIRIDTSRPALVPHLSAAIDGAVLPSVSSRDPRRNSPNVWTTSNQIYLCPDPQDLADSLAAMASSYDDLHPLDLANEYHRLVLADVELLTRVGAI